MREGGRDRKRERECEGRRDNERSVRPLVGGRERVSGSEKRWECEGVCRRKGGKQGRSEREIDPTLVM